MIKLNKNISDFTKKYICYLFPTVIIALFIAPVFAVDKTPGYDNPDILYDKLLEDTQLSIDKNIIARGMNIELNESMDIDIACSFSIDNGPLISLMNKQEDSEQFSGNGIINSDFEISYEINNAVNSYKGYLLEKEIYKTLVSPDFYTFNNIVIADNSTSKNSSRIFKTFHMNMIPSSNNHPARPDRGVRNNHPKDYYKDLSNYNYTNEICAGSYMFRLFLYIRQKDPDGGSAIFNILDLLLPTLLVTPSFIFLNLFNKTLNHISKAIKKIDNIYSRSVRGNSGLFVRFLLYTYRSDINERIKLRAALKSEPGICECV